MKMTTSSVNDLTVSGPVAYVDVDTLDTDRRDNECRTHPVPFGKTCKWPGCEGRGRRIGVYGYLVGNLVE